MTDIDHKLFGDISIEIFLSEYWQQKPLLVRQAFQQTHSIITAEELAGLACEPGINSRVVIEKDGDYPWQVMHGPFEEAFFSQLPEKDWSLLVSDVERHLPETRTLLEYFRFIPDWRIDDLMISYAPPGGSVGPHTDEYDVFLIQLDGQRRWQISQHYDASLLDIPDLKILAEMNVEQDWLLAPGDMLYLPPNIAHHGVAQLMTEDNVQRHCLTASVGFRAPSVNEMTASFIDYQNEQRRDERYRDQHMQKPVHSAEIDKNAIDTVIDYLRNNTDYSYNSVQQWFGEYISDNHLFEDFIEEAEADYQSYRDFRDRHAHCELQHSAYANFLFSDRAGSDDAWIFVNGQSYPVSRTFARRICSHESMQPDTFDDCTEHEQTIVLELINQGALTVCGHDD